MFSCMAFLVGAAIGSNIALMINNWIMMKRIFSIESDLMEVTWAVCVLEEKTGNQSFSTFYKNKNKHGKNNG